jgi:ribonucleoside-triphosphate reductase
MNKELNTQKILSDVVVYTKYAKYLSELKRRETWDEIVIRYLGMMKKRYPKLRKEIDVNGNYLHAKMVLPSMRALQFAGPAMEKNEARGYNCSYMPMDDYRAFSELMFLLLGGTGAGYSVQYHHVEKLPGIQQPTKRAKYLIGDSIEGWSDAVKQLMKAYFGITKVAPRFDYSDIREKGARLVTAGGKAPGPEPLRIALTHIESILSEKANGDNLTPFEVHRICCLIADAVLAGGIRRAALIALFSMDDKVMATCKYGTWWEKYPELGRANNSATILRNRVKKNEFDTFWKMIVDSNSGEPGIYFTNDPEYGTNPCCEISLRPFTFCNLTEINAGTIEGQADLEDRARVAGFFGTLQAGITDFHYLRNIWRVNTEKDA